MTEPSSAKNQPCISLAALGDISFMGRNSDRPSIDVFSSVSPILGESHLVVANLESPLTQIAEPVPKKCVLRGSPEWANVMKKAGISIVNLANNHMMDYGARGLLSTIDALEKASIYYVGGGRDKKEACAPAFVATANSLIAFLGATSVIVSSPIYARKNEPGVAFLDAEQMKRSIIACKDQADFIIILIHWGLEEYSYPSPQERILAREFLDAGACLIFGHHPHVLQGVEPIGNKLACYSLGNFIFDNIQWCYSNEKGELQHSKAELTHENRKGGIFRVALSVRGVESYNLIPTFIGTNGIVKLDDSLKRHRQFALLCSRLKWPGYKLFWRAYSIKQEWSLRLKPLLNGLSLKKLKKLRFKHLRQFLDTMRRSAKITAEKSTNPYE